MPDIGAPWAFLFEHPLVGITVFTAICASAVVAFSGGRLGESLGGLFRVFLTIFTTPFIFLRDAIYLVRSAEDAEQDYAKSSVFLLFRANRIWYMVIFVLCLLMLAGGITSAVLSVYPRIEIEQARQLDQQILEIEAELATARTDMTAAPAEAPNTEQLAQARSTAQNAHQNQVESNAQFVRNTPVRGPLIDRLANSYSEASVQQVRDGVDREINNCMRRRNSNPISCGQYRAAVLELADRKDNEIRLARAAQEADAAWRQAENSVRRSAQDAANREARVEAIEARLQYAHEQRASVDPWNAERMADRILDAVVMVLQTLWSVVVFVWLAAILIDVFNWFILMMRSLERGQLAKLRSYRDTEPR